MRARLSIVVPTKNSARTIKRCLESSRHQIGADVEVVVVDNHSTDGTFEIAQGLAGICLRAGPERSRQRNLGASAASGEFVAFIDSDMVLDPGIARQAIERFADPTVVGLVIPEHSFGHGFWASCRVLEKQLYLGDSRVEAARIFRRDVFLREGGYDETLTGPEDWEMPDRLRRGGGSILRIEAPVYHDEGALRLSEDLRKKFYYGRTLAHYVRTNPSSSSKRFYRTALLRPPSRTLKRPTVFFGLLALKSMEAVAALAGAVANRAKPHAISSP